MMINRTRGARGGSSLNSTLHESLATVSLRSTLQVFGQCGRAIMRTRFYQNFFLREKDLTKPQLNFSPAERGLGDECGRVLLPNFSVVITK